MGEFTYIKTDAQFGEFLERLSARGVETIAADIEVEFNLHVYGERFCLLQLYDGHEQVVVDPFTVSADAIKKLLENPVPGKITYDSASDRLLLAKSHGIAMAGIVDLRPAVELREFERLHAIRDRHARALDLPPNTVVKNDDLFGLVTGRLTAEQIGGNRRLPNVKLRSIKDEFAGRDAR